MKACVLSALMLGLSGVVGSCGPIVVPSPDKKTRQAAEAGAKRLAELENVAGWMEGEFTSEAQAQTDRDYRGISLTMTRVWTDRIDGPWLYVEQALSSKPDKPYRQRMYRLNIQENGLVISEVYTLPGDISRFVGAVRGSTVFSEITPKELSFKDGCSVVLKKQKDGTYKGGTVGKDCASELQGANYATSEVLLTPAGIDSWDRGFDKDGKQVWGAEKGPYQFRKTGS